MYKFKVYSITWYTINIVNDDITRSVNSPITSHYVYVCELRNFMAHSLNNFQTVQCSIVNYRLLCLFNGKESTCSAGDEGSIPGLGRFPGEGNGNPFQCSCLGNPMDRGNWQATVHEITEELDTIWWLNTHTLLIVVAILYSTSQNLFIV